MQIGRIRETTDFPREIIGLYPAEPTKSEVRGYIVAKIISFMKTLTGTTRELPETVEITRIPALDGIDDSLM